MQLWVVARFPGNDGGNERWRSKRVHISLRRGGKGTERRAYCVNTGITKNHDTLTGAKICSEGGKVI